MTTRLAPLGRVISHGHLIYAWTTCQAPSGCHRCSHLMTVRLTRTTELAQPTSYLNDAWLDRHWTAVHTTRLALLVSRLISA